MNIQAVIKIMKTVHDAEGWSLGTASTRDQRNYFLERVCGIVHWGHEKYNPTPDPQWHCKDPDQLGSGRPASDDVVVSMPSRTMYDCIPGCGADGYTFANNPNGEHLPDQTVFAPRKPKLVDGPNGGTQPPPQPPTANTVPFHAYDGDAKWVPLSQLMEKDYRRAHGTVDQPEKAGLDGGCGMWLARTIHDCYMGESASKKPMTFDESVKKHRAEWCAALGIPVD